MIAERGEGRFIATVCSNSEEARAAVLAWPGTIIIADLDTIGGASHLPDMGIGSATIATSANVSLTTAIAAMKGGAIDFLPKPIGAKALIEHLESAVAGWRPAVIASEAPPAPLRGTDFAGFIGRSAPMLAVYDQIKRMAPSRAPVFITGESGTGKELTAEAIHALAGGSAKPFIAINCSAIPKDLMESEIFGHVRGAFTGASENRTGAAELADGGTLFLDEVTEMDLGLQAKLLRFVQTGSLRRVGGSETRRVDVRIVSATNRDAFAEVATGRLRADLFYRLHVLPIHLLPLRERREDILPLADAFLQELGTTMGRPAAGISRDARDWLLAHHWPGNARELRNAIERAILLCDGGLITREHLPKVTRPDAARTTNGNGSSDPSIPLPAAGVDLEAVDRGYVEKALRQSSGNKSKAARLLGLTRAQLYSRLEKYGLR